MRINKSFEKYHKLICERAASFHRSTGVDYDELIAQGNLIFLQVKGKYRADNNATFTTFLYRCLTNKLCDFVNNQHKHFFALQYDSEELPKFIDNKSDRYYSFLDKLLTLSKEAQYITEVLFKSPIEVLNLTGLESSGKVQKKLYAHLKEKGWMKKTILNSFKELREIQYN